MRSLSHGAKLVVQDVVDSSGWSVPDDVIAVSRVFDTVVINSWSWGDNTEDYTERSSMIDKWTVENPWSLASLHPAIQEVCCWSHLMPTTQWL